MAYALINADWLRVGALAMTAVVAMLLPGLITWRIGGWRAALVGAILLTLYTSQVVRIAVHFGDPIVWYGTPMLILANSLSLTYIVLSWGHVARDRRR